MQFSFFCLPLSSCSSLFHHLLLLHSKEQQAGECNEVSAARNEKARRGIGKASQEEKREFLSVAGLVPSFSSSSSSSLSSFSLSFFLSFWAALRCAAHASKPCLCCACACAASAWPGGRGLNDRGRKKERKKERKEGRKRRLKNCLLPSALRVPSLRFYFGRGAKQKREADTRTERERERERHILPAH